MTLPLANYANAPANTKFDLAEIPRFDAGKMFKISAAAGQTLTLNNYDASASVSELKIYKSDGTLVSESLTGWNNTLSADITETGDYYLHVRGADSYPGLAHSTFTVKLNTTGGATATPLVITEPSYTNSTGTGFTQAQLDAAVATATAGLFTQAQLDAAVAAATALPPAPTPTVTTNPLTLDKTDASGVVTLYKASTGYTAITTDHEIKGNANANVLTANDSGMKITGAAGADTIAGGAGSDTMQGDAGADSINGGTGADTIMGGADADTLNGDAGADSILGGAANDTLNGGGDADILKGEAGNDLLHGDAGNDTLQGDAGDDVLHGDTGDDIILGGAGLDTLNGGDGADSLSGEAGNDVLNGDAGIDTLVGAAGNDVLNGGADDDVIIGGVGIDVMTGGLGADTFVFDVKDSNIGKADTITDYTAGDIIKIVASNAITILGNYEPAVKAVAGYEATATTAAIAPVIGKAAVNLPTANTAAFEVATGKLYINTDVDDTFEYSIQLTGVTDASQISIVNVAAIV